MRAGGTKLGQILRNLLELAQPGVSLDYIEDKANELINAAGGSASFKMVKGYRWATCLCVNEVVVHGIPGKYVLAEGDILTIDVGIFFEGFHTDTAWTKIIQAQNSTSSAPAFIEKEKFLETGKMALQRAIAQARQGNRIGHISQAIQSTIEGAGYSVVKTLVGHGVGTELHEAPQVPGFVRGQIENTMLLEPGMTIAIEVIYAMGSGSVVYANDDGWTLETKDRSLSAVFEHTVEITTNEPVVLTKSPN